MIPKIRYIIILFLLSFLLSSCDSKNRKEKNIDEYIHQTKQKLIIQTQIEYTVPKTNKITYQATSERNPFENPFIKKLKKSYPNAILREHSLDSLRMIGIISQNRNIWGILSTPDGKKYKVTIGMRVGVNHALITKITEHQMILEDQSGMDQGQKPIEVVLPLENPK